ncbi:pyridoxamine 5'-phosphate oxidase [Quadrisphaera sp. DSM 44207]|uniref:pyridoxamine 5'-phosphate oxidase n=1 Tax=Quadrisphaera sp. DSM 44207 TaxID=1881057 RepID=UPI002101A8BC|nr:pyridoxamine 5'-phosphate oxidase [Quadrisphaera sp. DSM 44207]
MDTRSLADRRVDYGRGPDAGLLESDLAAAPLAQFEAWYAEVEHAPAVPEPNAVVLATVDAAGLPDARTVLLKGVDARGFTFYTNHRSAKGAQLAAVPAAALVLPWHGVQRQVRVRGAVEHVPREESAAYFTSRPWGSRIGAWASQQSQEVGSRGELEAAWDAAAARWPDGGAQVPLPEHWGGYLVRPVEVEFWVGRSSRLHDRLVYVSRTGAAAPLDDAGAWRVVRRQP